ncbi:unnamed protein product, partial [Bubo scandiacus]
NKESNCVFMLQFNRRQYFAKALHPRETYCKTGHRLDNPSANCVQLINTKVLRTILNCLAFRDLINWLITMKVT